MDPDAAIAAYWRAYDAEHRCDMDGDDESAATYATQAMNAAAELFRWLSNGGFPPRRWNR